VALGQSDSALALGNLVGSSIANVLASFSLGLLFMGSASFDRSSQIYASALLAATTLFWLFLWTLGPTMAWLAGITLVMAFVVYIGSIAVLIVRGTLMAPKSDSDSESDEDDDDSTDSVTDMDGSDDSLLLVNSRSARPRRDGKRDSADQTFKVDGSREVHSGEGASLHDYAQARPGGRDGLLGAGQPTEQRGSIELSNLPHQSTVRAAKSHFPTHRRPALPSRLLKRPKPLWQHVLWLLLGFLALLLSSYIVAHSASNIGKALGLNGTTVGTTLLSLATTLPEKFVAVLSGVRRQPGIMVANTVGSNIFLATICAGVLFLWGDAGQTRHSFTVFEAVTMWASAALMLAMVLMGARRWMGGLCLCLYLGFLAREITAGRRIGED
jgi:Ca2+/Na+ antiporter